VRLPLPDGVEVHRADLATADLKPLFEGASVIVHLSEPEAPGMGEGGELVDGGI